MLQHTFDRAETLIPAERLLVVVAKDYLSVDEVHRQIAKAAQHSGPTPEVKETAPGLLLPLMHIYKRCPEAIVAVFPSDAFYPRVF